MKAVFKELLDKSLGAVLSAIEVYNKPDFKHWEECFVILLVNAWELLLKAKILKDSGNKLSSLYVRNGHRYKRTRTGNYLTIELLGAMQKVGLDPTVIDNLTSLVEIRDTAVHFYNDDGVRYVVYTLGVAALRNFQTLIKQWFGRSLTEYHFFILPLGFAHCFKTFRSIDWTSPRMVDTQLRVYNHPGRSINGKDTTHLHPRVQGRGRPARHRAGLLRRRGRSLPRPQ